ncbi:MAG TPA: cation-translocating P-type ATPase [Firmicutes bacterium]|nr:cation-translocating P-type ATPase [Bacillota bacterium]
MEAHARPGERVHHTVGFEHVARELGVDLARGLTPSEADERLARYGPNALQEERPKSVFEMLLEQFKDFLVLILIASTFIAALLGELLDAGVILAIVVLNAIMGLIQERRAERALSALKKMAAPVATVFREGKVMRVPAASLVPGDVVILQAGDLVPADLRLVEAVNLKIDEAALTGESVPVEKDANVVLDLKSPLGDRVNMAYMGTTVTYGRGKGIVSATGMSTEIGKIAKLISTYEEEETPLQRKLGAFGRWLGLACLAICAIVFILGLLRGEAPFEMFMTAVSLAVAAIPEGLPAIVTVVLALGVQKMIARNAIIRRLPAVETLGCATFVCSDKTGTLTENKMMAKKVMLASGEMFEVTGTGYEPVGEFRRISQNGEATGIDAPLANEHLKLLLSIGAGCNDASLEREEKTGSYGIVGDPTEGALVVLAEKAGLSLDELRQAAPRVQEIPFDSRRKRMTTIHKIGGKYHAFVKGAPDILLSLSSHYIDDGTIRPLGDAERSYFRAILEDMAAQGMRVLGMAYRVLGDIPREPDPAEIENDLVFVGAVGMMDPIRQDVKEAVRVCQDAGIRPVMVTGDYPLTARAVARELGMIEETGRVVSGPELEDMQDHELEDIVMDVSVYARVSPEHKLRIVEALKKRGQVVAMTGDGVNDAPALRKADIGVAMGITGTDVAKGASDMVLTDDNFASIIAAIEQGRTIFENIRKFIIYLLSCNIGELLIFLIAILAGLPRPLVPVQILMINLVTDGLPALALGVDPAEPGIMKMPPRDPREGILTGPIIARLVMIGVLIAIATLLPFYLALEAGLPLLRARTMAFATMGFAELWRAFGSRSERRFVWNISPLSNPQLVVAIGISALLILASITVGGIAEIFQMSPLTGVEWEEIFLISLLPLAGVELTKVPLRRATR